MYLHNLSLLQFSPSTSVNLVEKLLLHIKNKSSPKHNPPVRTKKRRKFPFWKYDKKEWIQEKPEKSHADTVCRNSVTVDSSFLNSFKLFDKSLK